MVIASCCERIVCSRPSALERLKVAQKAIRARTLVCCTWTRANPVEVLSLLVSQMAATPSVLAVVLGHNRSQERTLQVSHAAAPCGAFVKMTWVLKTSVKLAVSGG